MSTILITVGLTLLGIFILASLVYIIFLSRKINKLGRDYESLKWYAEDTKRYAEKVADEIYREFALADAKIRLLLDGKIEGVGRNLEEAQRVLYEGIADAQRNFDSRYDQLLNRIEKEYVRRNTSVTTK